MEMSDSEQQAWFKGQVNPQKQHDMKLAAEALTSMAEAFGVSPFLIMGFFQVDHFLCIHSPETGSVQRILKAAGQTGALDVSQELEMRAKHEKDEQN